jgi:hypothetical protein
VRAILFHRRRARERAGAVQSPPVRVPRPDRASCSPGAGLADVRPLSVGGRFGRERDQCHLLQRAVGIGDVNRSRERNSAGRRRWRRPGRPAPAAGEKSMALVDRVRNIVLNPRTEWPVIAGEAATVQPLANASASAGFACSAVSGQSLEPWPPPNPSEMPATLDRARTVPGKRSLVGAWAIEYSLATTGIASRTRTRDHPP